MTLTIGKIANLANVSTDTLRYCFLRNLKADSNAPTSVSVYGKDAVPRRLLSSRSASVANLPCC
jgi:hypothetical protein